MRTVYLCYSTITCKVLLNLYGVLSLSLSQLIPTELYPKLQFLSDPPYVEVVQIEQNRPQHKLGQFCASRCSRLYCANVSSDLQINSIVIKIMAH